MWTWEDIHKHVRQKDKFNCGYWVLADIAAVLAGDHSARNVDMNEFKQFLCCIAGVQTSTVIGTEVTASTGAGKDDNGAETGDSGLRTTMKGTMTEDTLNRPHNVFHRVRKRCVENVFAWMDFGDMSRVTILFGEQQALNAAAICTMYNLPCMAPPPQAAPQPMTAIYRATLWSQLTSTTMPVMAAFLALVKAGITDLEPEMLVETCGLAASRIKECLKAIILSALCRLEPNPTHEGASACPILQKAHRDSIEIV